MGDPTQRPGWQVGDDHAEVSVGARLGDLTDAVVELVLGDPALAVGGLEHVHGALPVRGAGEHAGRPGKAGLLRRDRWLREDDGLRVHGLAVHRRLHVRRGLNVGGLLRKRLSLVALGHRVRRRYSGRRLALELGQRAVPTTADPMLKPERWANMPDLLLHVNNHIAAFVDGKVEDWSRSNKVSIYEAWELERIGLTEHRREELPPVIYL